MSFGPDFVIADMNFRCGVLALPLTFRDETAAFKLAVFSPALEPVKETQWAR
jgi:hypothetical protein